MPDLPADFGLDWLALEELVDLFAKRVRFEALRLEERELFLEFRPPDDLPPRPDFLLVWPLLSWKV